MIMIARIRVKSKQRRTSTRVKVKSQSLWKMCTWPLLYFCLYKQACMWCDVTKTESGQRSTQTRITNCSLIIIVIFIIFILDEWSTSKTALETTSFTYTCLAFSKSFVVCVSVYIFSQTCFASAFLDCIQVENGEFQFKHFAYCLPYKIQTNKG